MIKSINHGDALKCLKCARRIVINSETFAFDSEAEYIKCPHCGCVYDAQAYHLYGEFYNGSDGQD